MTGSPASASPDSPVHEGDRVLVCGTNWLGDTIMALPALQAYRAAHPDHHVTVLTKPSLRTLWAMHAVPDEILVLEPGNGGLRQAARDLRGRNLDQAYILPNSFRAALVPYLAGIPDRIGRPRFPRTPLLTQKVPITGAISRAHQYAEYFELFGLPVPEREKAVPSLQAQPEARERAAILLAAQPATRVALIPGAARGPSKQWPEARFLELGQRVAAETPAGLLLLGTPQDEELCARLADRLGPHALNLAGKTSLPEFAAVLAGCSVVVANDSGGMHLATAMGSPVIALFGITDPGKTGPLGPGAVILQHSEIKRRDVPRESEIARRALEAINTDEVFSQVTAHLTPMTPPQTS